MWHWCVGVDRRVEERPDRRMDKRAVNESATISYPIHLLPILPFSLLSAGKLNILKKVLHLVWHLDTKEMERWVETWISSKSWILYVPDQERVRRIKNKWLPPNIKLLHFILLYCFVDIIKIYNKMKKSKHHHTTDRLSIAFHWRNALS